MARGCRAAAGNVRPGAVRTAGLCVAVLVLGDRAAAVVGDRPRQVDLAVTCRGVQVIDRSRRRDLRLKGDDHNGVGRGSVAGRVDRSHLVNKGVGRSNGEACRVGPATWNVLPRIPSLEGGKSEAVLELGDWGAAAPGHGPGECGLVDAGDADEVVDRFWRRDLRCQLHDVRPRAVTDRISSPDAVLTDVTPRSRHAP